MPAGISTIVSSLKALGRAYPIVKDRDIARRHRLATEDSAVARGRRRASTRANRPGRRTHQNPGKHVSARTRKALRMLEYVGRCSVACVWVWRRGWDSNPRTPVKGSRFSKPLPWTARPPLRPPGALILPAKGAIGKHSQRRSNQAGSSPGCRWSPGTGDARMIITCARKPSAAASRQTFAPNSPPTTAPAAAPSGRLP